MRKLPEERLRIVSVQDDNDFWAMISEKNEYEKQHNKYTALTIASVLATGALFMAYKNTNNIYFEYAKWAAIEGDILFGFVSTIFSRLSRKKYKKAKELAVQLQIQRVEENRIKAMQDENGLYHGNVFTEDNDDISAYVGGKTK